MIVIVFIFIHPSLIIGTASITSYNSRYFYIYISTVSIFSDLDPARIDIKMPRSAEDYEGPGMLSSDDVFLMNRVVESRGELIGVVDDEDSLHRSKYQSVAFDAEDYPHEGAFAATRIQTVFRGYSKRKWFLRFTRDRCGNAATVIQRVYRYRIARREGRLWREREMIRRQIELERVNAIIIQKVRQYNTIVAQDKSLFRLLGK